MAITLADLKANAQDKLLQGFINEVITDSYLLSAMPFDDCMASTGTSDLVYSYKRVKTPMSAAFRAINAEPAVSDVKTERCTTNVAILSDAWKMDRVAKEAAEDLYELHLQEAKNAIVRKFNATVVGGDVTKEKEGFDGLSKALKGSSTELASAVDLSTVDKAKALAFATEMDTLLSGLARTPDALLMSSAMHVRVNAVCRELGIAGVTMDTAGKRVATWDGIRIEELRDGAMSGGDVYAVCFGLSEFHGVTLKGGGAVAVHLPDWNSPGAVKTGDCELVCGCALKATKAAGVLREYAAPAGA